MRLSSVTQALASLLAFSQLLYAAPDRHAYTTPVPTTPPPLHHEESRDDSSSAYGLGHVRLVERAGELQMNQKAGWGTTWFGFVQEPPNAGWTKQTIRQYAKAGYEQAVASFPEVTLVSALWIRGEGIWLGSIPHGDSFGLKAQTQFAISCPSAAPRLWQEIGGRRLLDPTKAQWHAEDMALFSYEQSRTTPLVGHFPDGAYMTTYGQRNANEGIRFQQPCTGEAASIWPDCRFTLNRFDIAFD